MLLSSLVSSFSSLTFFFPLHYFVFSCNSHFLFNFHYPFLGFLFLLCLLLSIIICINPLLFVSLRFFPFIYSTHSLSLCATKDDASDKTDGKIISLCFTSDNLLVLFFFLSLLFRHFIPVHVNSFSCSVWPQRPLLSALHSTLICITILLSTSLIKLITHLKSSSALPQFNLVFNTEMV